MSKVTYLLGAGASFGERAVDDKGRKYFLRGLPVLSELERAIDSLLPRDSGGNIHVSRNFLEEHGIKNEQQLLYLFRLLLQLEEMCASYPTIDTLARQLYVTKGTYTTTVYKNAFNYDDLKYALTLALLMLQSHKKRDLRYDGFIASVIKDDQQMPPMTILSWNYDAQFELAYSGYSKDRYIPHLWQELNVLNKTYPTGFDVHKPFAMIKLNGTAFFKDITHPIDIQGQQVAGIRDCFFGEAVPKNNYQYGTEYANASGALFTTLSYAWEPSKDGLFRQHIFNRIHDTETLIVIGYSFPYVKSDMDSYILERMLGLRTVYIQDPNYEDVKERMMTMIPKKNIPVHFEQRSDKQFYIPKEF